MAVPTAPLPTMTAAGGTALTTLRLYRASGGQPMDTIPKQCTRSAFPTGSQPGPGVRTHPDLGVAWQRSLRTAPGASGIENLSGAVVCAEVRTPTPSMHGHALRMARRSGPTVQSFHSVAHSRSYGVISPPSSGVQSRAGGQDARRIDMPPSAMTNSSAKRS